MNPLISVKELRLSLSGQNPPVVIDVRGEDEYRAGHIAGAVHAPAGDLDEWLARIPKDRPVVPY